MLRDLFYLFFPSHCASCDRTLLKNEHIICLRCRHELPVTNYHFLNVEKIEKVFYGRIPITNATALLSFHKDGLVQNLIHNLKYRGQENIGKVLGNWLGSELKQISAYQEIDIIIPVPIHRKRMKERGYNQVAKFGQEIAKHLHADYIDFILKKKSNTFKQSKKNRQTRWENTQGSFIIENQNLLQDKHILLVDDIITTGATLESCALLLLQIPNIKISIATMAITE